MVRPAGDREAGDPLGAGEGKRISLNHHQEDLDRHQEEKETVRGQHCGSCQALRDTGLSQSVGPDNRQWAPGEANAVLERHSASEFLARELFTPTVYVGDNFFILHRL